ncbi:MAG: cysteine desulfurase [Erysipelothrix sp.]
MARIRDDFPFIVKHPDIAYFDNAATTLKPKCVIDAVTDYYENLSSNIHRGDYETSLITSQKYEAARQKTADFIKTDAKNIVFTSGASESLNLVAYGYGKTCLKAGDVVLLNESEHASNTLPWYSLAQDIGIKVEFIKLDANGRITETALRNAMHEEVKVVSIAHISNVLGYINDIKHIGQIVHEFGAVLCVDGAQSIGHMAVDVNELDVDFYAFSAHKMLGPTGVGVLYGKPELLKIMNPIAHGGGSNVRFNACGEVVLKEAPAKFEAGTPNIEGVIGFGAALDYLSKLGMDSIHEIVDPLHKKVIDGLLEMDHVKVYNPESDSAIVSFSVDGIFAQDVAAYLNKEKVYVRSGEHCAKMLNGVLHAEKSIRLSLYFYNTEAEVSQFLEAMRTITLEKCIDLYI